MQFVFGRRLGQRDSNEIEPLEIASLMPRSQLICDAAKRRINWLLWLFLK